MIRIGPTVQPQFMPSPDPLLMLFRGLGYDGKSTKKSNSNKEDDGLGELKMLPGASYDYQTRYKLAEAELQSTKNDIINESTKYGDPAEYYKNSDALSRWKEANMKYQQDMIELSSLKAQKEQEAVRYKEQQKYLQEAGIVGNSPLYDSEGNWGIEASVTKVTPNGKVYSANQLDAYNQYRDLDTQFVEVPVPDYKYFNDRKKDIFSNLGTTDVQATYKRIQSGVTLNERGEVVKIKESLETANQKTNSPTREYTNVTQLGDAIKEWNIALRDDPKLRQVYNIMKNNWDANVDYKLKTDKDFAKKFNDPKYKGFKSFDEELFSTANKYIDYKDVGQYTMDMSEGTEGGYGLSILSMLDGIKPNKDSSFQPLINEETGMIERNVNGNRTWVISPTEFTKLNDEIATLNSRGNYQLLEFHKTKEVVYTSDGLPQDIDVLIDAGAFIDNYNNVVQEFFPPNKLSTPDGGIMISPPSYEPVKSNMPSYTQSLSSIIGGVDKNADKMVGRVTTGAPIKTINVSIMIPQGDKNWWWDNDAYKAYGNLMGLTSTQMKEVKGLQPDIEMVEGYNKEKFLKFNVFLPTEDLSMLSDDAGDAKRKEEQLLRGMRVSNEAENQAWYNATAGIRK